MTDDTVPTLEADLDTIRGILKSARTATVTSRAGSGALHSRPLALLSGAPDGVEHFERTLWFFTEDPSPKTEEIGRHPDVNVAVASDGDGYLSLSGRASIDRSQVRIDQLWNPFAEAWFEGGKDDPRVALLRVDVDTVEVWDIRKPLPLRALEVAKALITKTPPDVGDSRTISL